MSLNFNQNINKELNKGIGCKYNEHFRVVYDWLPYEEFLIKTELKCFKKLEPAKRFFNELEAIPKDDKNERIWRGSAKIERLGISNINKLNNTKEYKWYKI